MIDGVVALDPPRAAAIWTLAGPLWALQVDGTTADAVPALLAELDRAVAALDVRVRGAIVEKPYGVQAEEANNTQAMIENAIATGRLGMACEVRKWPVTYMNHSQWASVLRWPAVKRQPGKILGHRLATKAKQETMAGPLVSLLGPRGGLLLDASDAVCISCVGWTALFGQTGAMGLWRETGSFRKG